MSSAGAGPAISIIKALKRQKILDCHVLALASDEHSAGCFLADSSQLMPKISCQNFLTTIIEKVNEAGIQFFIPILDAEVNLIAENLEFLSMNTNTIFLLNSKETVNAAVNKDRAYAFNREHNIRTPEHYTFEELLELKPDGELLMKPKVGVGARGHRLLSGWQDATKIGDTSEMLFCEYIRGPEYSIDALNLGEDEFVIVPRLRSEVRAGQMVKGEVVADSKLIATAKNILRAYGVSDVACLQLICRDNEYFFVELNPRYGTGISLSIAAGPNFPVLQIQKALGKETRASDVRIKVGLKVTRYWEEIYYV